MQMNNTNILSQNFIGDAKDILKNIDGFLKEIKTKHPDKNEFHLVHALVFSKTMSETEVNTLNLGLGDVYRSCGFDVLGGDTSSGAELSIFISTIVC